MGPIEYTQEDYRVLRSICKEEKIALVFCIRVHEIPLYKDFLEYMLARDTASWGVLKKLIYETPLEDMPLYLSDDKKLYDGVYKYIALNIVAVWRLKIGK